ncbi:helix-turn-helix domain-containing protein [Corynebacterium aquilae]|uniref:helix-turn-helix domain-containing protein n=1 Tax=Corynebacterium aquilae TaxID=203263 RepID=UPI0009FF4505
MGTRYLTVKAFAERADMNPEVVRRLCRRGDIKARRISNARNSPYRIPEAELDQLGVPA